MLIVLTSKKELPACKDQGTVLLVVYHHDFKFIHHKLYVFLHNNAINALGTFNLESEYRSFPERSVNNNKKPKVRKYINCSRMARIDFTL